MLLPSLEKGSGPFPANAASWATREPATPGERFGAASFYCALMTATCLELIGAEGPIIVEGPFASNMLYLEMLATACGRPVTTGAGSITGTSIGAAMLADMIDAQSGNRFNSHRNIAPVPDFQDYCSLWNSMSKAENRMFGPVL